jgi:hypothetical protein
LVRHRESRFTLSGAHVATACIDCHKPFPSQVGHRYLFTDTTCTACHSDPHGSGPGKTSCETCHVVQSWKTLARFDHDSTRFPLRGAHQTAACLKCHKTGEASAQSPRRVVFKETPGNCSGCHEDIHAGQFLDRPGGSDCATCHGVTNWRPSLFDHGRTEFPLDGGHRGVACVACHKTSGTDLRRSPLVYRMTPKECAACH